MSMRDDVECFIRTIEEVDGAKAISYSPKTVGIYENLVDEEYAEFVDALEDHHKLNEAMDLIWVTLGYCIARGWDVEGAWNTLTTANMAKLQVDLVTGHLKRRADGKIQKPEGWQKPDFTPFV